MFPFYLFSTVVLCATYISIVSEEDKEYLNKLFTVALIIKIFLGILLALVEPAKCVHIPEFEKYLKQRQDL